MKFNQDAGQIGDDLERLKLRIRRCSGIPAPSGAGLRLLDLLKNPNAAVRDFEAVISGDPNLASALLRTADTEVRAQSSHATLRELIMRLGTKGLKSLAWSATMRSSAMMSTRIPGFVDGRFARHSHAVAFLSKYLFARKFHNRPEGNTRWSADEIYLIGLVHDMSYPLLALVAPDVHTRVAFLARKTEVTMSDAFQHIYGQPMTVLTPEIFSKLPSCEELHRAIALMHAPWDYPEEYESLCCVVYADYLATGPLNLATEDWKVGTRLPPEITEGDLLSDTEIDVVNKALEVHFVRCREAA